MIILAMVSVLVGAVLGQGFKVMVLIPAVATVVTLAFGIGVTHYYTAWSVVLMGALAATSMQIGYLIGISIHHALAAVLSGRSSNQASPTTSARRSAH